MILSYASAAQSSVVPAPPQEKPVLLKGAIAHIGDGNVIQNSVIGFDKGKITYIGNAGASTLNESQYQVIDVSGKHIYPGFILIGTNLGLVETSSTEDTRDFSETGELNSSVRSIVAYNTDSELIPTMRFNGILMAQTTPMGGIITGNSSVVQLDAWNWEDAAYKTDDAIHLNWPSKMLPGRFFLGETQERKNPEYEQTLENMHQFFENAITYKKAPENVPFNLKMEGMEGLFDGSKGLFIHVNDAKAIIESVQFAQKHGVKKVVIIGGAEAHLITDFLKSNNIPVVLEDIHSLPNRPHDDAVLPYKMPKILKDAGVDFCISDLMSMTARQRNLPFTAGTAVAYGLEYEDAVKAITLDPARYLGIDGQVGSLATGKDATLFVSTGDALDMRGNNLEMAFIQGRRIQLNARQQWLYEKYSNKYGHKVYLDKQ